ncbi:TPA: L-aspartate oxidase [Legionella pneumophila]|uniref:L-aspartate oxidase n=1 Tax=Legionella pneumophila TaxID=446 RepID=A0A2S6F2E1_LEGPN|nr:L-aspartate oxidase [Legionella pneumophila subsp. fraseri]PPK31609.1 L-aspartate oxidase [Legionella pneumophila]HAT7768429.1 L-aspartate oxidase [Legionella pneumophila]HAT8173131.1 L-aspartate oxidase [Legionella pneumophila]HAT8210481.1 L-aspartate oxidase [Legionella pneumophila]
MAVEFGKKTDDQLSQQGHSFEFDVLVIGTGLAGLHYCLQLLAIQPRLNIALISKAESIECNSRYAQGGIAAAILPEDSLESHISDTLLAGDGLCYLPAVEFIIRQGPDIIKQLDQYKVQFKRESDGRFHLAKEGGHSHRRIFNCGDQTGLTLTQTLNHLAREYQQIHFFEHHVAVNLITQYHPHRTDNQGEVLGAYILDCQRNRIHTFLAKCVILATGGAGKTYRYTTNPMVATGDGVAMAYRAGARVGNMEFYQFHPTLLHHHSINNFLISEAVRGEGALLKNPETGERFMKRYAPDQLELATRDVVARAIFSEIEQGQAGYVHLDISHQSKSFLKKRFPQIYSTLLSIGIDMSQDLIPVVPAAHYQCGGVLTDVDGRTDLARLYAIGEVAFTGLHGANRLASNSLLEALVMGSNAARCTLKDIATPLKLIDHIPSWSSPGEVNARRASQINAQWRGLRGEMTSYAGIVRTEAGLEDLLQLILKRKKIIEEYYWKHCITRDFIELRNIILNAELIVRAALSRRESRGGHFREDFPNKNFKAQESIAKLGQADSSLG